MSLFLPSVIVEKWRTDNISEVISHFASLKSNSVALESSCQSLVYRSVIRLIYKERNSVLIVSEQITDHRCERWVHMSFWNRNKMREMMTNLGTHLLIKNKVNVCTITYCLNVF